LDFGEIEKDLAAKISDDDIRGVLLSIDAVNNLKKLRLTNCIHVTGAGLMPLRASTIIRQIDLSLVGDHESPRLDPAPLILCTDVLPILDSIIERGEECSLKHLMLPNEWRKERNTESDFHAFLTRYNELLCSREGRCLECRCNLPNRRRGDLHMLHISAEDGKFYGTQKYTCYDCTKQYCEDEDGGVYYIGGSCDKCERIYCLHCEKTDRCTSCGSWYCVNCTDFRECSNCHEKNCLECGSGVRCHNNCCADKIWCDYCFENGDALSWCERCNAIYCVDCCVSDIYAVKFCDDCKDSLCGQCRVKKCEVWRDCARCYQFSFPVLLEDKERMRTKNNELENENKEQHNVINELKLKVKDFTDELEEE